ncbi:hypothetical protein CAXC1_320036 [Candidatus Xenohaliotis californiensis]|uniref:Uncharacterized protein n=1 Tax=Candidatus Xenohaliotis californiensis TaxID=84677 RepID=A0ABP0ET75_9RICK|nr:hypothetical protein CAXC1_320036 [Candidatus Xenohaliotis californiensis]
MPTYNDKLLTHALNVSSDYYSHFIENYLNSLLRKESFTIDGKKIDSSALLKIDKQLADHNVAIQFNFAAVDPDNIAELDRFLGSANYTDDDEVRGFFAENIINNNSKNILFREIVQNILHNKDVSTFLANSMANGTPLAKRNVEVQHLPVDKRAMFYPANSILRHTNYSGIQSNIDSKTDDMELLKHIKDAMDREDAANSYSRFGFLHEKKWFTDLVEEEAAKAIVNSAIRYIITNGRTGVKLDESQWKLLDSSAKKCLKEAVSFVKKRDETKFKGKAFEDAFNVLLYEAVDSKGNWNSSKVKLITKGLLAVHDAYQHSKLDGENVVDFARMMDYFVNNSIKSKSLGKIVVARGGLPDSFKEQDISIVDGIVNAMNFHGISLSDMREFFQLSKSWLKTPTAVGRTIRSVDLDIVDKSVERDARHYLRVRDFLHNLHSDPCKGFKIIPSLKMDLYRLVMSDVLDSTDKAEVVKAIKAVQVKQQLFYSGRNILGFASLEELLNDVDACSSTEVQSVVNGVGIGLDDLRRFCAMSARAMNYGATHGTVSDSSFVEVDSAHDSKKMTDDEVKSNVLLEVKSGFAHKFRSVGSRTGIYAESLRGGKSELGFTKDKTNYDSKSKNAKTKFSKMTKSFVKYLRSTRQKSSKDIGKY